MIMRVTVKRGSSRVTNHGEGGLLFFTFPKVLPVAAESVGFNLYAILFSLGTELRTL